MRLNIKTILTKLYSLVFRNKYLVLVMILAVFLRFYKYYEHITFLGDQGRDAIIALNIISLKKFPGIGPISSIGNVYLGPFYYYLVAPFLFLAGGNPAGMAFGVTLISLLGLFLAYWVLRPNIKHLSAVFVFLIAVSFVSITYSRFSWNPNLLSLVSFFTVYFLFKTIAEKKIISACLLGVFLGVGMQLHYLFGIFLPFILAALIIAFCKQTEKRYFLKKTAALIAGYLAVYLPFLLFEVKHRFVNTLSLINLFLKPGSSNEKLLIVFTKANIFNSLSETVNQFFRFVFSFQFSAQTTNWLFWLMLGWGIYLVFQKKNLFFALSFGLVISYLLIFALINSYRHEHYYMSIYWLFYFVLLYEIKFLPKKLIQTVVLGGLVIFYTWFNFQKDGFFFRPGSRQIAFAEKVASSINNNIKNTPIQIVGVPLNELSDHYRYFLIKNQTAVLPEDSTLAPAELFVVTHDKNYRVLDDYRWQIASLKKKKIVKMWKVEDLLVYKIINGKR